MTARPPAPRALDGPLPWSALLAPAASGALIAAPFLNFALYPLAWVACVPLLQSLARARHDRDAAWMGAAAGLGANVPGFYWLVYTMHVFGGFPYPLAVVFYACLSAYSALQFVLFAVAVRRLGFGALGLGVPLLWVTIEFLYPNLFPWRIANTQAQAPALLQIGDLTGPLGLSFAILWVGAGLATALPPRRRWAPLAAAAGTVGAVIAYGVGRTPVIQAAIDAAPAVRTGLVQGNVGIVEKSDAAYFEMNAERYRLLSERLQDHVDVLVWPESVAQWWIPAQAAALEADLNPFVDLRRFLIFGGLSAKLNGDGTAAKYNSAFLIGPQGRVLGRYDKQVLLPFGEYLPGASIIPALAALSPQTGDFTPGTVAATLDVPGAMRVAPLVCYEDVPARIARDMTRKGAEVLLTMFNDAWFGVSAAPYQHEAAALWRAIENRRYFLRVGNAGVTGLIDPFGRVVQHLGLFTEETMRADVRPLRLETFYTRYGDVFAWSVTAVTALWAAVRLRGDRRSRGRGT